MSQKKWTLKSLAQELGVSIATMSNAYNRPDQLSEALRERILRDAAALGYNGPSAAASSLRTGRTGVVGVMISHPLSYSFVDPVAGMFLEGVTSELDEHGMNMLMLSSRMEHDTLASHVSLVDGFIVYGPPLPSVASFMKRQSKPLVTVDFEMDDIPAITVDDFGGCYRLAKSCLEPNKRIAIVGLRLFESDKVENAVGKTLFDHHYITIKRLQGFVEGAAAVDMAIEPSNIWCVPENTHAYGREVAEQIFASEQLPDFIFCMSDRLALAVIEVAREMKINVPKDVKVSGFDDIPESKRSFPSLTTVAQQCHLKGKTAAQMFTGQRQLESIQLDTTVQFRMSCMMPIRRVKDTL